MTHLFFSVINFNKPIKFMSLEIVSGNNIFLVKLGLFTFDNCINYFFFFCYHDWVDSIGIFQLIYSMSL